MLSAGICCREGEGGRCLRKRRSRRVDIEAREIVSILLLQNSVQDTYTCERQVDCFLWLYSS